MARSLAEAVANRQLQVVDQLLDEEKVDINQPGSDGTTPLCAASLWGDDNMVKYLLKRGAKVNALNSGTRWTPLHAAAFQEHGKVVRLLLEAGADPNLKDHKNRTAADYATLTEAIWPFFAAKGCVKTSKADLLAKGLIEKTDDSTAAAAASGAGPELVPQLSRPGSAYVRVQINPFETPSAAPGAKSSRGYGSLGETVSRPPTAGSRAVDLLGEGPPGPSATAAAPAGAKFGRNPSLKGLGL